MAQDDITPITPRHFITRDRGKDPKTPKLHVYDRENAPLLDDSGLRVPPPPQNRSRMVIEPSPRTIPNIGPMPPQPPIPPYTSTIPATPVQLKRVPPTGWGTTPGQPSPLPEIQAPQPIQPSAGEIQAGQSQAQDIAARTNQAQHDRWNMAMRQRDDFGGAMGRGRPSDMLGQPPQPRDVPPAGNDPYYAIQGLQGNVMQRMGQQGDVAAGLRPAPVQGSFKRGGTVPRTGNYKLHRGEKVIPSRMAKRFGEACG